MTTRSYQDYTPLPEPINALLAKLQALEPGEVLIYYRGLIACCGGAGEVVKRRAWELMEAGSVHLFQRRVVAYEYEYLAVGVRKRDARAKYLRVVR